jgi:hypothetical protein
MFDAHHAKECAIAAVSRIVAERDDAYDRLLTWLRCAQRTADKVRKKRPRPRVPNVSEG